MGYRSVFRAGVFDGQTVIVTGGGSGIGRAVALALAAEGARVVVADSDAKAAERVSEEVSASGGTAVPTRVDVSRAVEVEKMVALALVTLGRVDVLFNGAGVLVAGTVLDTDEAEWRRVLDVNLTGTYLCCRAVIPRMIEQGGGAIVNTSSSTGAHDGNANAAAYVTSKGGVTLLTRCLAIDHAADHVRVNAVAPGPTDTPMLRKAMSPEVREARARSYPAGRLGQPEEIASAVLYLASDDASFVTGAILAVDGGQTAQV